MKTPRLQHWWFGRNKKVKEKKPELLLPPPSLPTQLPSLRSLSRWRWIVLFLMCLAMFGSYYVYDNPAALKKELQQLLDLSDVQFNLLYSVYSFPNIILPLFGGFFVDIIGAEIMAAICASFVLTGHILFTIGVIHGNFFLAVIGRAVFGLGGESLCVAQTTVLANYFRAREVALSMGVALTVARLGSVVNDNVTPLFYYSSGGVGAALWFGAALCGTSLCACIFMILLDRNFEKNNTITPMVSTVTELAGNDDNSSTSPLTTSSSSFNNMTRFVSSFSLKLGPLFNILCISCFLVYSSVLPFNNILGGFLIDKYHVSTQEKGILMGIPFFVSACLCPFLGYIVDKFGKRGILQCISAVLLTLSYLYLTVSNFSPIPPLIGIGMGYALYASVFWPSIALAVEKEVLGGAYGIITSIQNSGLALVPLCVGLINDYGENVSDVGYFFISLSFMACLFCFRLYFLDIKTGGALHNTKMKKVLSTKSLLFEENNEKNKVNRNDKDAYGTF